MILISPYEQLEAARRAAWKQLMRSAWGSENHRERTRQHNDLTAHRDTYLRELLTRLPFRWHVAHAYTARETATHGGADHIVVDEPISIGRLVRAPGDALSRPQRKFLALYAVEAGRLPTSLADIKIAERLVTTTPKPPRRSAKQLAADIATVVPPIRDR